MDDLISRQAAIDALKKHEIELPLYSPRETDVFWDDAIDCCVGEIESLPSAVHPGCDEWCTGCKEYDQQKHSCPRWNRVIRQTVEELEKEPPEIIRCRNCKHWKDSDGVYRRGIDAESKCPLNTQEVYAGTFYCGYAERRGE